MEVQFSPAYSQYYTPNAVQNQDVKSSTHGEQFSLKETKNTESEATSQETPHTTFYDTAIFDTSHGKIELNLDHYLSPPKKDGVASFPSGKLTFDKLPPLLFPTKGNLNNLSNYISEKMPKFLAENDIPSAPSKITYGMTGEMILPSDYAHAEKFKEALEENPQLEKAMRTLNALTSHYVGMQESMRFQEEYAQAGSQAEIDQLIRKYSHLFGDNRRYASISLEFSEGGALTIKADGEDVL